MYRFTQADTETEHRHRGTGTQTETQRQTHGHRHTNRRTDTDRDADTREEEPVGGVESHLFLPLQELALTLFPALGPLSTQRFRVATGQALPRAHDGLCHTSLSLSLSRGLHAVGGRQRRR